jgi:N-acetylglutamate synthase-like GNAT family acetyltransferase
MSITMINTTEVTQFNVTRLSNTDIEVHRVTTPLADGLAWEIESLLLKIFEYGDYSFRSALLGRYSDTLNCSFFLAKLKSNVIGVAGCLYANRNPGIAIVGPVGVAAEYRGDGVGTRLVASVINHLKLQGCMAVYLGVSPGTTAADFYKALGFKRYKGVVMRFLLCSEAQFEKDYFGKCADVKVRQATWGDFPGIQGLMTYPCGMYTIDFQKNIFSSKYIEPTKFLSVFPEMMKTFAKHGGFANVLVAGHKENIVGFAHINRLPGEAQRHIAEFDFYVHDCFIDKAELLVQTTIKESACLGLNKIYCYCLNCDKIKLNIIKALCGTQVATLSENVFLKGIFEDVLVYELRGTT